MYILYLVIQYLMLDMRKTRYEKEILLFPAHDVMPYHTV